MLTAAAHPELVRALVIGEPPIFPLLKKDPEGARLLRHFLDTAWLPSKKAFQAGDLERGVELFYEGITGPGSFDKLSMSVRTGMLKNAPQMKTETITPNNLSHFGRREARKITMPCLLLNGEKSPRIFYRITDILEHWLTHAERKIIPAASHSMHSHNPRAYNETVLKFLLHHEARPAAQAKALLRE